MDKTMSVDHVMSELSDRVEKRGYPQEIPSFVGEDRESCDEKVAGFWAGEYDENHHGHYIYKLDMMDDEPYDFGLRGSRYRVFVKKVIKKAISFVITPIMRRIEDTSYYEKEAHIMTLRYIHNVNRENELLRQRLDSLEEKVRLLEKQNGQEE